MSINGANDWCFYQALSQHTILSTSSTPQLHMTPINTCEANLLSMLKHLDALRQHCTIAVHRSIIWNIRRYRNNWCIPQICCFQHGEKIPQWCKHKVSLWNFKMINNASDQVRGVESSNSQWIANYRLDNSHNDGRKGWKIFPLRVLRFCRLMKGRALYLMQLRTW